MEQLKKFFGDIAKNKITKSDALNYINNIKNNKNHKYENNTDSNKSDMDKSFLRVFKYNETYLRDHTVFGEQVLLGVTHCSLAIEAFYEKFKEKKLKKIHRMLFVEPVILKDNEETEVIVQIIEEKNKISFKNFYKKNNQEEFALTASGEFLLDDEVSMIKIDHKSFTGFYDKTLKGIDIYNQQSIESIQHGPSLKTLKNVYLKGDEILGELELTSEILESTYNYRIHPAFFDGAIMSAISFQLNDPNSGDSYVPFMIKDVIIHGELSNKCYCYSKVVTLNKEVMVCDITLCDDDGNGKITLQGFTCKRVESADVFMKDSSVQNINNAEKEIEQGSLNNNTKNKFLAGSGNINEAIEEYLFNKFSQFSDGKVKISKNQNFMDMGIDSNQLLVVAQEMENEIGIELYPTIFFEQQSISELSEYFLAEYKNEFSKLVNTRSSEDNSGYEKVNSSSSSDTGTNSTVTLQITNYLFDKFSNYIDGKVKINKNQNFMDMGIDSNQLLIVAQEMENEIGMELYPTIFFEKQNIDELTEFFESEYEDKFLKYFNIDKNKMLNSIQPDIEAVNEIQKTSPSNEHFEQLKNKILAKNTIVKESSVVRDFGNFTEDIAIIGMGGEFAGSPDIHSFWKNIREKKDLITEIPFDHFDYRPWYDPTPKVADKLYCKWGSFIDNVDKFDTQFFKISPREAEVMDPQLRRFLQVLYSTAEDAGIPHKIRGSRTGLFVGVCFYDYLSEIHRNLVPVGPYDGTGNAVTMYANRPSFYFDLKGPSLAVDTACSSSLVALHLACRALQHNECETAFVGGINLLLGSWHYRYFSSIGALSETGRCHSFDKKADGYVPGDGIAAVLLKPLSKAIADNDRIHAVIKGSAINHGGYTPSITAPSVKQEADVIINAWKDSGVDPETIGYIEAHGTGTKLGDPIEVNALNLAFKKYTNNESFCVLGSTKAHIGHTEGAAGVTGIIKTVLSMKHKEIPVMPKFEEINPYINLKKSPLYINTEIQNWEKIGDNPRRAGVSSFGFGGSYAHIVLEDYEKINAVQYVPGNSPKIASFSARNKERLFENIKSILNYLESDVKKINVYYERDIKKLIDQVKEDVCEIVAETLSIKKSDIDYNESFEDYGVEQIHFNNITNELSEKYQINLNITDYLEYSSVNKMAEMLTGVYENELVELYPACVQEKKSQDSENIDFDFESFIYTLHVGREQMEERLAVIASSLDELVDKLRKYINGDQNIERVYSGNIDDNNSLTDFIVEGKAGEKFINELLNEHAYEKLVKIWIAGVNLDWSLLYTNTGRKNEILSFPGYQFAKERHWVFDNKEYLNNQFISKLDVLHPLVQTNISNLAQQKYSTIFTGKEFYLSDHMVGNQNVLPGVAYLEMACAAGELAAERAVSKIKNVVWLRPIIIDGKEIEVNISLHPETANNVSFEVFSNNNTENIIYSKGKIEYFKKGSPVTSDRIDIQEIKNRCLNKRDGEYYYKKFNEVQLRLEKSFQVVQYAFYNEKEAIGKLKLPGHLLKDFSNFKMIPVLLDGALHPIIELINLDYIHVPFSLEEIEIFDKLKEECYSYVTIANDDGNNGIKKYNIIITDESGNILVKMKNYLARSFKQHHKGEVKESSDFVPDIMYYTSEWIPAEILSQPNAGKSYIIFSDDNLIFDQISESIAKNHNVNATVLLIRPGKGFNKISEYEYIIDIKNENDFKKLFDNLDERNIFPDKILYNLSNESFNKKEINHFEKLLENSINPLFLLSKSLLEKKPVNPVDILNLFINNTGNIEPHNSAISSFGRSLSQENKKVGFKNLEIKDFKITKKSVKQLVDILISEFNNKNNDDFDICYNGDERYTHSFKEYSLLESEVTGIKLKSNAVYIITGGLGGLGSIFSEYFAKNYKAKLVLTGRSLINEEISKKIKKLESYGADVAYFSLDINKHEEVETLIELTKEKFNVINGVIHCAGIIKDDFILKKSFDDFQSVIQPKYSGTLYLDKATEKENLDFFVLFSSITGVLGNIGQSDYAYANAFMDNFAIWRNNLVKSKKRNGKTLSVNWPLWRNGGMHVDVQTEKYLFQSKGLSLLGEFDGIDAFVKGIASEVDQLIVLAGDKNKVRKTMNIKDQNNTNTDNLKKEIIEPVNVEVPQSQILKKSDSLILQLKNDLTAMVSDIIRIDSSKINPNVDMSEYGLDSIALSEFSNKMNITFDLELTPAVFFEFESPSINALSVYLSGEYNEILQKHYNMEVNGSSQKDELLTLSNKNKTEVEFSNTRFENITALESENLIMKPALNEPIAIIGMHGVMPGSKDPEEFWNNLMNEKNLVTEIPASRWDWNILYGDPLLEQNKTNIKWGGFIEDFDKFDASFFGISPKEAEMMDPQQRVFLETVWKAIEDAGYKPSDFSGTNTGLFAGVSNTDYALMIRENGLAVEGHTATGLAHSILANRISYLLNLHGPSEPIDTACSSALVAINRAVDSINSGNCDMAIVGGVNILVNPMLYLSFSKAGMLSPDGKCKTFDANANGYVRGEGSGAILLKPLRKAVSDGDNIYAVIKSSVVNHGGRANSLTAPNAKAQSELLIKAYEKAGIEPSKVSYIEAHGTGTSLGDPVEINGLKKAFKELYKKNNIEIPDESSCAIGSVKTNVGHLESAAGMAGIMKVLLSMKNSKIPATIHFKNQNPYIDLKNTPFYIVDKTINWEQNPKIAGISSFGFGGANAHVVLEDYPLPCLTDNNTLPKIIILSAKNNERLKVYVELLYKFLLKNNDVIEKNNTNLNLKNIAYTLQVGREAMNSRIVFIASTISELLEKLNKYVNGEKKIPDLFYGDELNENSITSMLVGGRAGKEFVKILLNDGEIVKLAQLWVSGVNIDWNVLYDGHNAQRISLPTYPFLRFRHWVDNEGKNYNKVLENHTVTKKELIAGTKTDSLQGYDNEIIKIIKEKSGVNVDKINRDKNLSEYGIDSITQLTISSCIINNFDFLSNEEDGDKLVNLDTLDLLFDYVKERSKSSSPVKTKKFVKKNKNNVKSFISNRIKSLEKQDLEFNTSNRDENNVICSNIKLLSNDPLCVRGSLVVDENHSFFFDHPIDHISGMHLAAAMNQLVSFANDYKFSQKDRESYVSSISLTFENFCLKGEESLVWAISDNKKISDKIIFDSEIIQNEEKVVSGKYEISSYDMSLVNANKDVEYDKLVDRIPCSKEIVNKNKIENVLISKVYFKDESNELLCWLLPINNSSFFVNYTRGIINNFVLLEACRQSFRAFSKHLQDMGRFEVFDKSDIMGILKSQKISIMRPILTHESVCFKMKDFDIVEIGKNKIVNVLGDILINNELTGSYEVQAVLLNNNYYKDIKGDGVKAVFKN